MWTVKDILALANVGALFCVVILYLWQQGRKKHITSGELSPEHWEKKFTDTLIALEKQTDRYIELLKEQNKQQTDAMKDLTQSINALIRTLLGRGHD